MSRGSDEELDRQDLVVREIYRLRLLLGVVSAVLWFSRLARRAVPRVSPFPGKGVNPVYSGFADMGPATWADGRRGL